MELAVKALVMVGVALAHDIESETGLKMDYLGNPDTCDKVAVQGHVLDLHYVGYLESGDQFDSTYDRQQPVRFLMGAGQVIKGWEEGVMGMCVGEKRRLIVPPSLGYGDQGYGSVPAGATVTFDVELVDANEPPKPVNVFKQMDANGDYWITRDELTTYLQTQAAATPDDEHSKKILEGAPYLQNTVNQIFDAEDADKDGYISHEEFKGPKHDEPPKPPNVFREMDANADQSISKDELTAYLKSQAEAVGGEEAQKILQEQLYLTHAEEIFTAEDADKDGFISHAEFKGPKHDEL